MHDLFARSGWLRPLGRVGAIAIGLVISATSSPAFAGAVKSWRQDTDGDFREGKPTRVIVSSDAKISLSRQLRPFAELKAEQLWSATTTPSGELIVGVGGPGAVIRVDKDGKATTLVSENAKQFFAVAVGPDGTIYAASSPGGAIVRSKPDGGFEPFFSTGETYVWALSVDPAGNVFAATGPSGKLFKIGSDKRGTLFFQAKQPHLLCLAQGPSGGLFVGTSKDGIIYRLAPDGKAFVVYDATQQDVHTLLVEGADIYAGTGTPARSATAGSGSGGGGLGNLGGTTRIEIRSIGPGGPSEDSASSRAPTPSSAPPPSGAAPAPAPGPSPAPTPTSGPPSAIRSTTSSSSSSTKSAASPGENSVYRLHADGVVEEVFREKALVLSLATLSKRLLVGTGKEGRLFEVEPAARTHGELARLEQGQVAALAKLGDGSIVVGAASPARLYRLEDRFASSGEFVSTTLDAKTPTRWGRAVHASSTPPGSTLEVAYRAGNIAEPDETWSAWTTEPTKLPIGRFAQYRVRLASPEGKVTPSFSDFVLYYSPINQAPRIERLEVPNLAKNPVTSPSSKLTLRWQASDPNDDPLTYRVLVRKTGWPEWVLLAKDVTRSDYEWDPSSMPGGDYQLRVVASDQTGNRESDTLTAEKTSEAFILDREPPAVKIASTKIDAKKLELKASALDTRTRIVSAAYSIDGGAWVPFFPDDGIFDSVFEEGTFTTSNLDPGAHVVVVRFTDAAGHAGVADTVVTVAPQ